MRGLLLINLGTPQRPNTTEVRRYLREFLSDPRVLDINGLGRQALLNLVILPTRPAKSAEAYRKIWTDRGSPLLFHTKDLAVGVAHQLKGWHVDFAMRYGDPSIESVLEKFAALGISELVVFPLYPQYAASSTGTALEEVYRVIGSKWTVPSVRVVPPFFGNERFLDAWVDVAEAKLRDFSADHVLLSFHGLPERHITKCDPSANHCLKRSDCCDNLGPNNSYCYRAQCLRTAAQLVERLNIGEQHTVCFQSRLGRTPWLKPFTDVVLDEVAAKGAKRIAVMCPAFVADCLETLEEIGIRAREQFLAAGGEDLLLIPSLNATPKWVEAVAAIVEETS